MEFIEGRSSIKILWASCAVCGDGVEVQFVPQRDAGLDVAETVILTFSEATRARDGWKKRHEGACTGPVSRLEAVPA